MLEIEDLIHEIKMPVLNVLMKYKNLQTMLDLKLDKSDFENNFENAQQIDEVYNKIKICDSVEEKKSHLVQIFSSGVDFLANPYMVVKNSIVAERFLQMFDKFY